MIVKIILYLLQPNPDKNRIGVKLREPHRGGILVEIKILEVSRPAGQRATFYECAERKKMSPRWGLIKTPALFSTIVSPRKGLWTNVLDDV
jgi:hypothetical protein